MKITLQELLRQAYCEGWRRSLEAYAVWKNGEQLTAMGRRARDEMANTERNCEEAFTLWLENQKDTYGRDSG